MSRKAPLLEASVESAAGNWPVSDNGRGCVAGEPARRRQDEGDDHEWQQREKGLDDPGYAPALFDRHESGLVDAPDREEVGAEAQAERPGESEERQHGEFAQLRR